ncbi:hypothetical protein [Saccharicrinis sp. FJH65]|uniref:hypothetical protein n=1 Tax=Saccharicrinis sp. FJH65 TaxID=3344659 RepID=UPI0036D2BEBB
MHRGVKDLRSKSRVNSSDDSESSDESVKCSAGLQICVVVQPVGLNEILSPDNSDSYRKGHFLKKRGDIICKALNDFIQRRT